MGDTPIGRHFLGIWTRERDDGSKIPMLVWRNVYEVSDGTRYEAPTEMCAPVDLCTAEEQQIAASLPPFDPPEGEAIVPFGHEMVLVGVKETDDG